MDFKDEMTRKEAKAIDWSNRDIVLNTVRNVSKSLVFAPRKFRDDKEIVLAAIRKSGGCEIVYASDRLQNDFECALASASKKPDGYFYLPIEMRCNREVSLAAVKSDPTNFDLVPYEMKADSVVAKYATTEYPEFIQDLPFILRDDYKLVLRIVKRCGSALRDASPRLRDNAVIAHAAVSNDSYALNYVSERLREDYVLNAIAFSNDYKASKYVHPKFLTLCSKPKKAKEFLRCYFNFLQGKPLPPWITTHISEEDLMKNAKDR